MALVLAVLIVASGPVLLRPMGRGDDVAGSLERVSRLAAAERWGEALAACADLEAAWVRVKARIAVTIALADGNSFSQAVAELRGALEARDGAQVRMVVRRLQAMWTELG